MMIGVKRKQYNDLTEISNLLKLDESNCNRKTTDFGSLISSATNPYIDGKFVPLHFELRGNYEVSAVGPIDEILKFFKLSIARENENGYDLGVKKEGESELRRNPKSPKYFANICNYDRKVTSRLKRDYFNLNNDEHLYFYRSEIKILNEEETIEVLKEKQHFDNFNKVAIHTIRRQRKYHKIFNLPYNLKINVTLVEDSPEFKDDTSLSFKIEDDNSISLSGTYEHVSGFIEPDSVNITLNIQKDNTEEYIESNNRWSFKELFVNTFRNNKQPSSLIQ